MSVDPTSTRTLTTTRIISAALVGGVLGFAIVTVGWFSSRPSSLPALALAAALAGLVAPVGGYRLYRALRRGIPPRAEASARCAVFQKATVLALGITEGIALVGVVVFALSREWIALTGVVTHVLVAGAIWPSRARLDDFLTAGGGEAGS
jgi:hypothetical protein